MLRFLAPFFLLLLMIVGVAAEPLSTVAAVRDLPLEVSKKQPAFALDAQVLVLHPNRLGGFVHDGHESIYAYFPPSTAFPKFQPGDVLRLRGVAEPGIYLPLLKVRHAEIIGEKPLRPAQPVSGEALFAPDLDAQWVTFEGLISQFIDDPKLSYLVLKMRHESRELIIRYIRRAGKKTPFSRYLHRRVRFTGISATQSNARRQMTRRYFQLPTLDLLQLLDEPTPQLVSIESLMRVENTGERLSKVRGTVTATFGSTVYLRDGEANLEVTFPEPSQWQPGEEIEVRGYISTELFAPAMLAFSANAVTKKAPPSPRPFPARDPNTGYYSSRWHHEFCTLEASLVDFYEADGNLRFRFERNGHPFEAELVSEPRAIPELRQGAEVRLQGIVSLGNPGILLDDVNSAQEFSIRLRNAADLELIKAGPWWTIERALIFSAIIATITALSALWAISLRRRVARQTSIIGDQLQKEASLMERQRLARELHDSLQQNMAGVSMQIELAQNRLQTGSPQSSSNILGQARELLVECQEETRLSILTLRTPEDGQETLGNFIERSLRERAAAAEVDFDLQTHGQPWPIDQFYVRHVLRICREAFNNAVQHAEPSEIVVEFRYSEDSLLLQISDDGKGFDVNQKLPPGHFGLVGMQERANLIDGHLEILSQPEKGTQIIFTISKTDATRPAPAQENLDC